MANNININGLTLKQILDLYSSEKLKKTLAGGTLSTRIGASSFDGVYNGFLPGTNDGIEIDPEALASVFSKVIDNI